MKNSPYLCKTKNKWRVRLVAQDGRVFARMTECSNPLHATNKMARSSTGLVRETDLSV